MEIVQRVAGNSPTPGVDLQRHSIVSGRRVGWRDFSLRIASGIVDHAHAQEPVDTVTNVSLARIFGLIVLKARDGDHSGEYRKGSFARTR